MNVIPLFIEFLTWVCLVKNQWVAIFVHTENDNENWSHTSNVCVLHVSVFFSFEGIFLFVFLSDRFSVFRKNYRWRLLHFSF